MTTDTPLPISPALLDEANAVTLTARLELLNAAGQDRVILYPPTYKDGTYKSKHVISRPDHNGISSHVLIDSVQSEARRISKYYPLLREMGLPDIEVRIGGRLYSATADFSHRTFDALLRDSCEGQTPWPQTEMSRALANSTIQDATALYRHAPATLIFGGWDSHTGKSNPFRIARSLCAEIWAANAEVLSRLVTKGSPFTILNDEQVHLNSDHLLELGTAPEVTKQKKPSEVGLGTVTPDAEQKGVIVDADSIRLTAVLSLNRLNRYRFPVDGNNDPNRDRAARNVLAFTGLLMLIMHLENGLDLRSGCDLEMVDQSWVLRKGLDGKLPLIVGKDALYEQLTQAVAAAEKSGLHFADTVTLHASEALETLVSRDSR
jgi:CRISPR-associated protein Csb1